MRKDEPWEAIKIDDGDTAVSLNTLALSWGT